VGSIAVAALDVLIDQRLTFHSQILDAGSTLTNPAVVLFLRHNSPAQLAKIINGQAAILSYADATLAIAVMCIACVPLVFLMRKPGVAPGNAPGRGAGAAAAVHA
jgi:hypothetical protein